RRAGDVTRLSSQYRSYYSSCTIKTNFTLMKALLIMRASHSLSEFQTLVNTNKGTSNKIITTIILLKNRRGIILLLNLNRAIFDLFFRRRLSVTCLTKLIKQYSS